MRRKLIVAVPLLCIVAVLAWIFRPKHETVGEGYISERSVTLWSSIAQVREPLSSLHYGDRVDIIGRHNDNAKVRTLSGEVGWIDAHLVMDPTLWQRSAKLLEEARALPTQARGRTKVSTNLRVQPGRTQPRLYQFNRGVPLEIVGRSVADWSQSTDEKDKEKEVPAESPDAKKEEWLLVRGVATRPPGENNARSLDTTTTTQPGDQTIPIAGWIVGRFVELDLPDIVKEGTASANVRPVAWFELNRIADPAGAKPQYLVAGTRGPEGQACDFSILRVYTWNLKKGRYETAFIEHNLCGRMPVRLAKGPNGEPEFRFLTKDGGNVERVYRLIQTVVRRIGEGGSINVVKSKFQPRAAGKKKRAR
ncbi:MAG: SH3 domain-containing protein [Acidobacteriota bacterium]|nr:SH3 domain-containing protein [Acidobacteriota bacterium]